MEESLNHLGAEFLNFAGGMLWQASLLIAVVFVADLALERRLRASVRHALWLVVLVKLLLPPTLALPTSVAWWLFPAKPIVLPAAVPEAKSSNVRTSAVVFDDVPAADLAQEPVPMVEPPRVKLNGTGWTFVAAGTVSLGLLFWLLFRWGQLTWKVRETSISRDGRRRGALQTLYVRAGAVPGAPRLRVRVVEAQMSPAVFGLFRPVILLPRLLAEKLSPEQLRAVLLHESIHVRRGDVWVNCAQSLLQIFYWWHPLVWLANARMRRVREEAVDDAVMVALGDQADTYAPTLLEVAKLAFRRPLLSLGILGLIGIIESRSALRQRVERLLDFRAPRRAGITFLSFCGIFLFSVVALPMGQGPAPIVKAPVPENEPAPAQEPPLTRIAQPRPASVLLSAEIYQIPPQELTKLASHLTFHEAETNGTAWWSASTNEYAEIQRSLTNSDFQPVMRPRIQTSSGVRAQFFVGNYMHGTELDCLPVVKGDRIDIQFRGEISDLTTKLETNNFTAEISVENHGGVVIPVPNDPSNSAVFMQVDLVAMSAPVSNTPPRHIRRTGRAENRAEIFPEQSVVFQTNQSAANANGSGITNIQTLIQEGKLCCEIGKLDEARNWLRAALANDPSNATAIYYLDQIRARNAKFDGHEDTTSVSSNWSDVFPRWPPSGRRSIAEKLDTIRLRNVSYDNLPLSEVLRQLSEQIRTFDPDQKGINFLINNSSLPGATAPQGVGATPSFEIDPVTGVPLTSTGTQPDEDVGSFLVSIPSLKDVRASDVLDAIVLTANHPLKYSIQNFAVVFSAKEPNPSQLFMRTFRIDTNAFYRRFGNANFSGNYHTVANPPAATPSMVAREFFTSLGIDLLNPPGKSVFYSYKKGTLFVKATEADLDTIEGALAGLNVEEQEKISEKLDRIHLLNVSFESVRLKDVVRQLGEMSVQADPEKTGVRIFTAFNSASSGGTNIDSVIIKMPTLSAARLVDVLDEIVLAADQPINYSIHNDGVVFFNDNSRSSGPITVFQGQSTAIRATQQSGRLVTQSTRPPFVDGGTPFPRGQGALVPRVYPAFLTENERETERQLISETVQSPSEPPQVHIKARFIAVPKGLATGLEQFLNTTNSKDGRRMGIFSNRELKAALQLLQAQPGAETLAEPEITVLSGRQSQIRTTVTISVVTNLMLVNQGSSGRKAMMAQTNSVEVGPILDVVPNALSDGYTINLTAIPSLVEFLGYNFTNSEAGHANENVGQPPKISPVFRNPDVVAAANVWDNQTLLLTGLEEHSGSVFPPSLGSSINTDQTKYKDIYIFITATLIDSIGSRIHSDTDLIALPPVPPQPK